MRTTLLHPTLLIAAVALCAASGAKAQTDYRGLSTNMLTVGGGFAGGASMTLDPPANIKVKPIFAWRFTADATYPLNPTVSVLFSLGLDSRGTGTHYWESDENITATRVLYLAMTPGFKFSSFFLAMNFGFPLSGSATRADVSKDLDEIPVNFGGETLWENVGVLLEPRLGVILPLMEERIGWLGLTLGAGYSLSRLAETESGMENGLDNMVSGHLGLTWQFGIEGTGRR